MAQDKSSHPVGGVVFFLALAALAILFGISLRLLILNLHFLDSIRAVVFVVACALGGYLGRLVLRGSWGVFLHELKHSIVSNLSGNRAKGMEVEEETGSFAYEYTRKTAHMNAFINIAPYVFPLFTLLLLGLGALWFPLASMPLLVLGSLGFGMDCYAHIRDVGPHQSDFQRLRGGYPIGLSFVVLVNATVFIVLLFWVLYGPSGWAKWLEGLLRIAYGVSSSLIRASGD